MRGVVILNDGCVCTGEVVLSRVTAASAGRLSLNRQTGYGRGCGVCNVRCPLTRSGRNVHRRCRLVDGTKGFRYVACAAGRSIDDLSVGWATHYNRDGSQDEQFDQSRHYPSFLPWTSILPHLEYRLKAISGSTVPTASFGTEPAKSEEQSWAKALKKQYIRILT